MEDKDLRAILKNQINFETIETNPLRDDTFSAEAQRDQFLTNLPLNDQAQILEGEEKNLEPTINGSTELLAAFTKGEMPLNYFLTSMLSESPEHQGGRKGSGFTQATRQLAEYVRKPRSFDDLRMFGDKIYHEVQERIYDAEDEGREVKYGNGWQKFFPVEDFEKITNSVKLEESELVAQIMHDIIVPHAPTSEDIVLPPLPVGTHVGTCTSAEAYFLRYLTGEMTSEAMHGHGKLNIITDNEGILLMLEKKGNGENSCLSVKPVVVNGVRIPRGSLFGIRYQEDQTRPKTQLQTGEIIKMNECEGFDFLRLTTLAVSPRNRERAFGEHYRLQDMGDGTPFPNFDTATVEDFARRLSFEVSDS